MKSLKQDGANVVKPLKKRKTNPKNKPKSPAPVVQDWRKQPTGSFVSRILTGGIKGASWMGGGHDLGRFVMVWVVLALIFVLLIWRAFSLQVSNADFYLEKGKSVIVGKRDVPVLRGMIKDTHGVPLAINAPLVTVTFNARQYAEIYYQLLKARKKATTPEAIARADAALEKMDLKRLAAMANYPLERLEDLTEIKPDVNLEDDKAVAAAMPKKKYSGKLDLLKDVTPEVAASVLDLDFAGVTHTVSDRRYYTQLEPMSQVLGYMSELEEDAVYRGRAGLERQYESQLAGRAGKVAVVLGVNGRAVETVGEISPTVAGEDLDLTLDSRLQYVLYTELARIGVEQRAMWTSGIVVDISNGDILAMGAWPSFNNNRRDGKSSEKNRPMVDVFEPGSVVKPFTVAAALESGKFTTNSLIDTGAGSMQLGNNLLRDGGAYGAITMATLIKKSSNIASARIALALPRDALANMQRKFGLGQKTAVNFLGEAAGKVSVPSEKDVTKRVTLSYGYGEEVTLAQLAQAYAALGNGGRFRSLRLDKSKPVATETQIISERHANDIVAMMELVTQAGGTAPSAAIDGYRVAGKTGTSKRYNPQSKSYYDNQYRALFAGVAPASNPRFAAVILVENPKDGYGGKVAAPVFSRVMQETLRLYNVPFDKALVKP